MRRRVIGYQERQCVCVGVSMCAGVCVWCACKASAVPVVTLTPGMGSSKCLQTVRHHENRVTRPLHLPVAAHS